MADVFVSYSRRDSAFVDRLVRSIERRGKQVWLDTEGIADAEVFPRAIRSAIESADAFVFVITPHAVSSGYCQAEIEYARDLGKRIVPVLRTAVDDEYLHAEVRDRNWIPFADDTHFDASLDRLVGAIDADLELAREHTRWLVKAIEWDAERRDRSFLLRGSELRSAEVWLARADADAEPAPTALQREYLLASRGAAARRQRVLLGVSLAVAAVAVGLLIFALISRNQAISERITATSQAFAAQSQSELPVDPEVSVLLAMRAVRTAPTGQATLALREALDRSPLRLAVGFSGPRETQLCGDDSGLSVAYSPDGTRIAVGGCDGRVTILNATTGRVMRHAMVARFAPAVAYSPNGLLLAVGTGGGVLLLDPGTLAVRAKLAGFGTTNTVAFSPSGDWLVAASDGGLTEWNVHTHTRRRLGIPDGFEFKTLAFTQGGRFLLAGEQSVNDVPVYDVQTGRLVRMLHTPGVAGAVVAAAGEQLAVATLSANGVGTVTIWRTSDWKPAFTAASVAGDQISAVAFSPDGDRLAIGDADGTAGIWSVATREKILALVGHTAEINQISYSPTGQLALTASDDGTIRVWLAHGPERLDIDSPYNAGDVQDMRLLQNRLVTVGAVGSHSTAMTWRVSGGRASAATRIGPAALADTDSPTLSPDGRDAIVLESSTKDPTLVYAVSTGRIIAHLPLVDAAAVSHDDSRFAIARVENDGSIVAYEIVDRAGRPTVKLASSPSLSPSCPADVIAFSADDRLVAAASFCGQVAVWNAQNGRLLSTFNQGGQISTIAFSPTAPRLAVASWDSTTTVWNVRTARSVMNLDGDTAGVDGVAYSPNGTQILTTSIDTTARLWDAATGSLRRVIQGSERLGDPTFSPNGSLFALADSSGVIQVWNTCPACGNARALLTIGRRDQTGVHQLTRLEASALGSR
jgi:WD40 repeat protein